MSQRKKRYKEERWHYRSRINQLLRECEAYRAMLRESQKRSDMTMAAALVSCGATEDKPLVMGLDVLNDAVNGKYVPESRLNEDKTAFAVYYKDLGVKTE